jgi:hypothetical protein
MFGFKVPNVVCNENNEGMTWNWMVVLLLMWCELPVRWCTYCKATYPILLYN